MGLVQRVGDIVAANMNDLVDRYEDPEKMLKQAIREMEHTIGEAMDAAVRVVAGEKLLRKQVREETRQAELWRGRAVRAIGEKQDAAARRALVRKSEHDKLVAALEDQATAAEVAGHKLRRQIEAMRARLADARRKLASLAARHHAAQAQRTLHRPSSGAGDSVFRRFDRMVEKVQRAEAEAEALWELTEVEHAWRDVDVDDEAEAAAAIEAELVSLKNEVHLT